MARRKTTATTTTVTLERKTLSVEDLPVSENHHREVVPEEKTGYQGWNYELRKPKPGDKFIQISACDYQPYIATATKHYNEQYLVKVRRY